jgi:hypothetical protein
VIDTTLAEKSIIDRIKTILPRVYVSEVPDGTDPGDPYIVVYFGDPIRTATDHHLENVRHDTMIGYLTVQVISKTDMAANAIKNLVKSALVGFIPYDSGPIVAEGGVSRSRSAIESVPKMYYRENGYSYTTNMIPD